MNDCGFIRVTHHPAGAWSHETLYAWGDFSKSPFVQAFHADVERLSAEMKAAVADQHQEAS